MTAAPRPWPADSPVIVLLGAGESRRYGSPKQLATIEGEAMIRRATRTAVATGVPVIVVTGAQAERVEGVLDGLSVQIARCDDWAGGMGHALAAGARAVEALHPDASALLLCLADQPLVQTQMLSRLLLRHRQVPEKILATGHGEAVGPPVLFPRDLMHELTRRSGAEGAKALLQRESVRVERCLASAGTDVDTPDMLDAVHAALALRTDDGP